MVHHWLVFPVVVYSRPLQRKAASLYVFQMQVHRQICHMDPNSIVAVQICDNFDAELCHLTSKNTKCIS